MSFPDTMLDEKVDPAVKPTAEAPEETAEKEPDAESDDDILKEARDRYRICDTFDCENIDNAKDDLLFLSGGVNQWDPVDAQIRTSQRRPMITVNNLPTFLHQVTNDLRQNKLGGRVHPVDENTDEETAEVVQGLIRHIEYDSSASVATMTAVNSAAGIGFGWFRLVTEYEAPDSFDQKIMFKRIRNALSVHIDPLSQELDGSDMKYCFIDSLEARAEFKKMHPDASANNTDLIGQDVYQGWFTQDTVLVCEYYRIKTTQAILCELQDGSKGWKAELPIEQHALIKRERKSYKAIVQWFKMTGTDILDRTEIMCEWIPVFPVYGDEIDIEGKVIRSGIIRNSKDSFKMYNVCITTAIEEVAARAKSPYIMAEGQDEGHKEQWNNINRIPYPSVKYKPTTVDGLLVPPPQRSPMADIPAGWLSMTMHFADNLKITYRHALRCVVKMLPHYYDAPRAVRILGEDESSKVVKINQPMQQTNTKTGAIETVMHDLTISDFDITVTAGAEYSTKRQEAAEFLTDAMQAAKDPAAASVLTYLAIKNQDLAGAEEATSMLKKLLPPGVVEPEEGEEPMVNTPHGPMPISKVGELIQQMGSALQNASKQMEQADIVGKQAEAVKEQNRQEELKIKGQEADTKRYEAETHRMTADAALLTAQTASTTAQTESSNADANVLSVAQAAAREAVSIILSSNPAELHPDVQALAQQPPAPPVEQPAQPPVAPPAEPVPEQPQV